MLRLFVAIAAPDSVKAALRDAQDRLRSLLQASVVAWSRPENMHLTLRFLGDVPVEQIGSLVVSLTQAMEHFGPLHLRCAHLDCFPNLQQPRVVWAGVHDEADRLGDLSHNISRATSRFSVEPTNHSFKGHITIGRIKRLARTEQRAFKEGVERSSSKIFGSWRAGEAELIQSRLAPSGTRHDVLHRFPLTP